GAEEFRFPQYGHLELAKVIVQKGIELRKFPLGPIFEILTEKEHGKSVGQAVLRIFDVDLYLAQGVVDAFYPPIIDMQGIPDPKALFEAVGVPIAEGHHAVLGPVPGLDGLIDGPRDGLGLEADLIILGLDKKVPGQDGQYEAGDDQGSERGG